MLANTQMMGLDTTYPDVCLTPAPPAPAPVPIPYPNIGAGPMGVPPVPTVLFSVAPAHNMGTIIPQTNGDNLGVALGVASALVMSPSRPVAGAFTCLVGGKPATRLTTPTVQNSTNVPGLRVVPSQVRVLILSA